MTFEEVTWPAVALAVLVPVAKKASTLIDRWFTAYLALQETKRERIEEGTKLIDQLLEDLADVKKELRSLNEAITKKE